MQVLFIIQAWRLIFGKVCLQRWFDSWLWNLLSTGHKFIRWSFDYCTLTLACRSLVKKINEKKKKEYASVVIDNSSINIDSGGKVLLTKEPMIGENRQLVTNEPVEFEK